MRQGEPIRVFTARDLIFSRGRRGMSSAEAELTVDGIDPFLDAYLEPFRGWLAEADVTELLVNRPGEVWIEQRGQMSRHEAPAGRRCAASAARRAGRADQPPGDQPRAAAACRDASQRRARSVRRADRDARALGAGDPPPLPARHAARSLWQRTAQAARTRAAESSPEADPIGFLREAVADRKTILISGGTSTGKTTFLNALLREVPAEERVIVVEDTAEVQLHGPNDLGLIAVKGELGEALINTDDLLQAALRLRPDRILLGELRGKEAVSFLRAVNTGHPGSFSTIHANSTSGALEQLALMVMQSGLGLSRSETIEYARSVIDVVVQLGREGAERKIVAIEELSAPAALRAARADASWRARQASRRLGRT